MKKRIRYTSRKACVLARYTTLRMQKIHILFSFLLLSVYSIAAKEKQTLDSIINTSLKLQGKEKLHYLNSQINGEIYESELIDLFIEEAKKQSDQLYLTYAYSEKSFQMAKEGKLDSLKLYVNLISDKLKNIEKEKTLTKKDQEKINTIKQVCFSSKATMYINEGKYNLALIEIQKLMEHSKNDKTGKMEAEAYNLLGITYLYTKNMDEAINSFKKAYSIKKNIERKSGSYELYQALEGITIANGLIHRYQQARLYADSLSASIDREYTLIQQSNQPSSKDEFKYEFLKNRARAYSAIINIKQGYLDTGRKELDEVKNFIHKSLDPNQPHPDFYIYYLFEAEYYLATKQYDLAEQYITTITEKISLKGNSSSYLLANLTLAKVINAKGNGSKAYDLIRKLYKANDSINSKNFSGQAAELQASYEIDKAQILIEKNRMALRMTRIILFVAIVAFLLALLIIYLILQNRKKIIEKNLQLHNQHKEIDNRNKTISELLLTQNNQIQHEIDQQDQYSLLMDKLDDYLEESKAYTQVDLSREMLALVVGTNRQYLIEAIKEKKGKTFNEYIYSYRLKHAYDLIMNNKEKTINDILVESGFNTRTTFYKTFKETYGMTPNELRDIVSRK